MKRILDIRIIFIVAALVAVMACGQTANPAAPPASTAEPQPTVTPPPQETPTAVGATGSDDMSTLPPAVQILSTEYQEAFRLLPDGEWARKYYAIQFDDFDLDEWSKADDTPPDGPVYVYELNAGDEFNLMRALRDEDAQEWIVEKVRELDSGFGKQFAAAGDASERLDVLRRMVAAKAIHQDILLTELFSRWQLGFTGLKGHELDRAIAQERQFFDTGRALWQLSSKERTVRINELRVCEWLVWEIVGTQYTLDVIANGQCDIAKAVKLSEEALQSGTGKALPTEDEYREGVEAVERLRAQEQERWSGLLSPTNTPTP